MQLGSSKTHQLNNPRRAILNGNRCLIPQSHLLRHPVPRSRLNQSRVQRNGSQPLLLTARNTSRQPIQRRLRASIGRKNPSRQGIHQPDTSGRGRDASPLGLLGLLQQWQKSLEEKQGADGVDVVVLEHVLGVDLLDGNGGGHSAGVGDGNVNVVDSLGANGGDGGGRVGGGGGFDVDEEETGAGGRGGGLELGDRGSGEITDRADDGVVGAGEVELGDAGADAWENLALVLAKGVD